MRYPRLLQCKFISLAIVLICLLLMWHHIRSGRRASINSSHNILASLDVSDYEESVATAYFTSIDSASHKNCHYFRMRFPIKSGSDGEMDLAFTITVESDIRRFARIMRMMYRENNYYCVHVDKNANPVFKAAVSGVAKCFGSNVELIPYKSLITVVKGQEGGLKVLLLCAEQALKRNKKWKYLINIADGQFPLRTNLELIAAMKALNGSNLIEAFPIDRYKARVRNHKLPLNAIWYKGSVHGAFRRDFVKEAVLGKAAAPVRKMLLEPRVFLNPEELFFPVLAYNLQFKMPGACLTAPTPPEETNLGYLGNFAIWGDYKIKCPTKFDSFVCVLGNAHLSALQTAPHLFAEKFMSEYEPEAYSEMEQWYFEKIKAEMGLESNVITSFNSSVYASRYCSKLHL
ncbi:unnamed protein product [Hymenolepis diminuta]|uniref:Uncharacterized protein n=1 Tax=Hymenolepis diminuta TaxID=6216 RepID=A0A3P6XQT1_HYMDI|nr:unnamed protein product [Hymenolepis diminuta]